MYWTEYAERQILNTFLGQSLTAPTALYARLYLNDPSTGTGTEVQYTGYDPIAMTFTTPAITTGRGDIQNSNEARFAESPTAAGTVTHMALGDAKTGGNLWAYMEFDDPIVITAGIAPLILIGELKYNTTGGFSEYFKAKVLNIFNGQNITGFAPYIALFNGNPDAGGAELAGSNYARFAITFGTPASTASGSTITNNADTSSDVASANWGTWAYTVITEGAAGAPIGYKQETPSIPMTKNKVASVKDQGFVIGVN